MPKKSMVVKRVITITPTIDPSRMTRRSSAVVILVGAVNIVSLDGYACFSVRNIMLRNSGVKAESVSFKFTFIVHIDGDATDTAHA